MQRKTGENHQMGTKLFLHNYWVTLRWQNGILRSRDSWGVVIMKNMLEYDYYETHADNLQVDRKSIRPLFTRKW